MKRRAGLFKFCIILSFTAINLFATKHLGKEETFIWQGFKEIPSYFIKNEGQLERNIKYYKMENDNAVFFVEDGVYLTLRSGKERNSIETVKIVFCGANRNFEIVGEEELKGKVNYFIGNNPHKWIKEIPMFGKIRLKDVYDGVDIVFHGEKRYLQYDIEAKPGANISKIQVELKGVKDLRIDKKGELLATLPSGRVINQKKPYIYQYKNERRQEIKGSYRIKKEGKRMCFEFYLEDYDKSSALVIDPTLIYSTYLGGGNYDGGYGISVDSKGYVYIVGQTFSPDFPVSSPLIGKKSGYYDIFITKIDPEGNSIVYSTFFGGNGNDYGYAVASDPWGNAYITGYTESTDFPTKNPIQKSNSGGRDVFVAKINSDGSSIIFSTYLGGSENDYGYGIAVDREGNTYITGSTYSSNFPVKNPLSGYSGFYDIFVTKINQDGSSLVYSTYFGGSNNDYCYGIAVDPSGNVYLTGATYSSDFPTKNPIKDKSGLWDAFLVKLSHDGKNVVLSTYLGGSDNDYGTGIAVDISENVYLTGYTSSADFPTQSPLQENLAGNYDAFVTKISSLDNKIVYSTFLGGASSDYSRAIAIDSKGNVYVAGETYSTDFPVHNPLQKSNGGYWDAFVTKINPEGDSIVYSTYLGGSYNDHAHGIAVDLQSNAYVTGYTSSNNFPTAVPLYGYSGGYDTFVAKIEEGLIRYSLTITKSGTGNGIVKSDDGGIDCGSDCSEEYDAGIVVTLTAIPDLDSTFTGWSGDCSGTDQRIEVKMDSIKNCNAEFVKGTLPDLVGEWKSSEISRLVSGIKVFRAILRVKNIGTAECLDQFKVSFYLSNDGQGLDYLLKSSTFSSNINASEFKDYLFSYYFAGYVSLTGKYIIAVIDPDNSLKERDKTNNRVSCGPFEQ